MKKTAIGALLIVLCMSVLVHAKGTGLDLSRFSDIKAISFVKDDTVSFFEAENWWLKKYPDIAPNSAYFYTPLNDNKFFSGVYVRFEKNALVMLDYVAKEKVSKTALNELFVSLGKSVKNKGLGVRTITKKNGTMYLIIAEQRPYRLLAVSAASEHTGLLKAHLGSKKEQTKR